MLRLTEKLCADTVPDGVWVGAEWALRCICEERCKRFGCEWRRFHKLAPDVLRRKAESIEEPQQKELAL